MKRRVFCPREIIFSSTTACNLQCEHCFVNRNPKKLDINEACDFLDRCAQGGTIEKVGFSGGEPFLYMDFLLELTKATISHDLLFDQIMTNGDWWQDEQDLRNKLQSLYDAGYDGKIGLSWDTYHGQSTERMLIFIKTVQEIFGKGSINIQTVEETPSLRGALRRGNPHSWIASPSARNDVKVYTLPRTYPGDDPKGWQARNWFREDYCQGPGNIFYVHADGNIAPCCGFANENPALFIGNIRDSFEKIMQNAAQNKMVQLCFTKGLSSYRRFKKFPGKTSDICTFCDYLCKNI
ncbi:MAG: radical SAM protein [Treponema sp.]|nr:radical SAM protein [Treponema sp.]